MHILSRREVKNIVEAKTKKGPHGGGNDYDEYKNEDNEFKKISRYTQKDAPGKVLEPKLKLMDGAGVENKSVKPEVAKADLKGFKVESLDEALDVILEHVGPVLSFKAPDTIGIIGAPSDDELSDMEKTIKGDLCPSCDDEQINTKCCVKCKMDLEDDCCDKCGNMGCECGPRVCSKCKCLTDDGDATLISDEY